MLVGDLIILAIIVLSTYMGFKRGFLRSLTGVLSTIISFALTIVLFKPIGKILNNSPVREAVFNKIESLLESSDNTTLKLLSAIEKNGVESVTEIALNLISFIVVIVVVKLLLAIVLRAIKFTSRLPIIKQANSLLGGLFGLVGGVLICYIVIAIAEISTQSGMFGWLSKAFENSFLSAFFYRTDFLLNIFKA